MAEVHPPLIESFAMDFEELFGPELALFRRLRESIKTFFAAESVIPPRLLPLVSPLISLMMWAVGVFKILVELRYTLLPLFPILVIFLLLILFTPPTSPIRTFWEPNPKAPLYRLPWPYPFSSWIKIHYRERKWFIQGCVGCAEGTPMWESYMKPKFGKDGKRLKNAEELHDLRVRKEWLGF